MKIINNLKFLAITCFSLALLSNQSCGAVDPDHSEIDICSESFSKEDISSLPSEHRLTRYRVINMQPFVESSEGYNEVNNEQNHVITIAPEKIELFTVGSNKYYVSYYYRGEEYEAPNDPDFYFDWGDTYDLFIHDCSNNLVGTVLGFNSHSAYSELHYNGSGLSDLGEKIDKGQSEWTYRLD